MSIMGWMIASSLVASPSSGEVRTTYRSPAVPLVVHDPYMSAWSFGDDLTLDWPRHWTGKIHAMFGMIRVDGRAYRFLGPDAVDAPPMRQISCEVFPTRTLYRFTVDGVQLDVEFFAPLLPKELELLSRPCTRIAMTAVSMDGRRHRVSGYFDATAEWAVDSPDQEVTWSARDIGKLNALFVGTTSQKVLGRKGDDLRIDWGQLAVVSGDSSARGVHGHTTARDAFVRTGKLPAGADARKPRRANDDWPVLAMSFDLGTVEEKPVSRRLLIAYDDVESIEYMGDRLQGYWRKGDSSFDEMIERAWSEDAGLYERCLRFERELEADLEKLGGGPFRHLAALAYRQAIGACKIVAGRDGKAMMFSKENFSNGCIGTVDVIYPSAPVFLLLNPEMLEAQIEPVILYAESDRWKHPFAPHDLGTYPLANGQVYGGGERTEENQMPVEECGNMLILACALAHATGKAQFAERHWAVLTKWADYLVSKGLDPENQLCTDDFAGHLAHNANLSLKAILGIRSYADLAERLGKRQEAEQYSTTATNMASEWMKIANDGKHTRLAFDKPGTWSQKYNLVWDRALGFNLFPESLSASEVQHYLTVMNPFGVPLDNRNTYTKLDWSVWIAALSQSRSDFDALMAPVYRFVIESPDRVPLSDWYQTTDGKVVGFRARSVVGGVFMPALMDSKLWAKWAGRKQ